MAKMVWFTYPTCHLEGICVLIVYLISRLSAQIYCRESLETMLVFAVKFDISFFFRGLQVNTNGILSFQSAFTSATPHMFPLSDNISLIAPFWDDVDITRFGSIFYRETSNATLLQRAQDQLQGLFPSSGNFTPTTLFIATWDRVAEFVPMFSVGGPQVHVFANMIVDFNSLWYYRPALVNRSLFYLM